MQLRESTRRSPYRRRRVHHTLRYSVYSGVFIISMIGGMVASNYLEKQGFVGPSAYAEGTRKEGARTSYDFSNTSQSPTGNVLGDQAQNNNNGEESTPMKTSKTTGQAAPKPYSPTASIQINEQFDGTGLNSQLWSIVERPRGYRNNEEQAYVSSAVSVSNGTLAITARRDATGNWTSGEVNSQWSYTYGEFEVRAKLSSSGPGVWPAAWLFNTAGNWPSGGEIDMYESINNESSAYGTIHGGGSGGHWQLQSGIHNFDIRNYHTYKIVKTPGVISWWVDGVKQAEWRASQLNETQRWDFDHSSYKAILNLAIGGNWPGSSTNETPDSITLFIDYFTVKNAS